MIYKVSMGQYYLLVDASSHKEALDKFIHNRLKEKVKANPDRYEHIPISETAVITIDPLGPLAS